MPLISVIIPVYNGEKTIRETIESVLNQTYTDLEVIVINDGSQDTTLEIVSNIQDPRLKVFSYPNAGIAVTRNRGASHSSGEYISFLDADDLWTPDKLETQLQALLANPQAAVAYSWTDCIDEANQFLRQGGHVTVNGNIYANLLVTDVLENGSNPLIRKQAFTEVGGFDESLSSAADWDICLRLAAHYQFAAVPFAQILYRQSSHSMSSNVSQQEVESLTVLERAYAQAPESLQYLKKRSLANLYKYLIFKALEGTPEPRKSLIAARLLWHAIANDPVLLRRRVIWKVLSKIAIAALLPPQPAQALLTKMKGLSNLNALLVHIQVEPS